MFKQPILYIFQRPKAFVQSENCTALFEACMEEGQLSAGLQMLVASLSTVRYPLPRTLHTVLRDILLVSVANVQHFLKLEFCPL